MSVESIQSAIISSNLSNDDLNVLAEALKYKRSLVGREVARTLAIGSQVQFTDSRNGKVYTGTLASIKIKNAVVSTPAGRYRVPLSMLTAV